MSDPTTTNLGLILPQGSDQVNITTIDNNLVTIDGAIGALQASVAALNIGVSTGTLSASVSVSTPLVSVTGANGALGATRFMGTVSGSAPGSGTYSTNDFVLDITSGTFWMCTAGGTPGTWVSSSAWSAPTGAVQSYGGSAAPGGWLLCNGSAVSRTTYAKLFTVVGSTFGSGDGETTFNIPDLRARATMMADSGTGRLGTQAAALGAAGGGVVYVGHSHTLTNAAAAFFQGSTNIYSARASNSFTATLDTPTSGASTGSYNQTGSTQLLGATDAENNETYVGSKATNLPPYLCLNAIIKY